MRSYRDLKVWQVGKATAVEACRAMKFFPKYEQFGICNQIRRCAVSIPSNVAEGHQRDSTKEFLHFLSIARGSLAELETQITISEELEYMKPDTANAFLRQTAELLRMLQGLQTALPRKLK
jgi:four helix bundle protein